MTDILPIVHAFKTDLPDSCVGPVPSIFQIRTPTRDRHHPASRNPNAFFIRFCSGVKNSRIGHPLAKTDRLPENRLGRISGGREYHRHRRPSPGADRCSPQIPVRRGTQQVPQGGLQQG